MKQKKISKKLVLNKETISSLNHREMSTEKGGIFTYPCTVGGCVTTLACTTTLREGLCGTLKCPPGPQGCE